MAVDAPMSSSSPILSNPTAPGGVGDHREFAASGTATGVGDLLLYAKGTVVRRGQGGFALGAEVRVPSGNEDDLLGSGVWGVKSFLVGSFSYKRIAPHVNLAYQWNGRSVLAGDVSRQIADDLPDRISFAPGFDAGVNERLSLALDVITEQVVKSPQLVVTPFIASGDLGSSVFEDITFRSRFYLICNGSAGMRFAMRAEVLATFNVRFRLGGEGLSDRLTPLIGIEYVLKENATVLGVLLFTRTGCRSTAAPTSTET